MEFALIIACFGKFKIEEEQLNAAGVKGENFTDLNLPDLSYISFFLNTTKPSKVFHNKKIDELNQETEILIDEIEKWQT